MRMFSIAIFMSAVAAAYAADPLYNFENFDNGGIGGWTNETPAKVRIENTGGSLNAAHLAQSAPVFVDDVVKLPVADGSYITRIAFRLNALDHRPSRLRLQLHSASSNHLWSLELAVPNAGEELVFDRQLVYSEGWSMGPAGTEELFKSDLRSVDWVGIKIRRNADIAAQNYLIDDFLVQGLFYIVDSDGDLMADSWEVAHGLNTNDASDAAADIDNDGISNYAEYRAGTDPGNWQSRFIAKIQAASHDGGEHGFDLHWQSTSNRTYTIWRTSDLSSGFSKLAGGIHSTPPENIYTDNPGTNTCFYKIEIDPEI